MPRLSKVGAAALAAFGWTGISSVTVSYLIVAGGGGGHANYSGGGGAGGLLTGTTTLNPTLSYSIVVGAGGIGEGGNGSNSTGFSFTAIGGGGGGYTTGAGSSGGSGGGAGNNGGSGGAGTVGQGNNGGAAGGSITTGGGGGAGAVGGTGNGSNQSGAGGIGSTSSISGTSTYYAGGGGGGGASTNGVSGGAGGLGGGGAGATTNGTAGTAGTISTGGGSGGSSGGAYTPSGKGGSGIVIISYVGAQQFGGGVVTSVGGNTIHTFTTSGTLVPATPLSASYLVVAGGGGGGGYVGGGGGAGGLLSGSGVAIDTNSTYLVTVGAGGVGAASQSIAPTAGGNSSWSVVSTTAVGGGIGSIGGGVVSPAWFPSVGGSGGGGGSTANVPSRTGAAGTSGQGNAGGSSPGSAGNYPSGGGGGAGAVGQTPANTSSAGGNGGNGVASSISGTSTTYAGGGGGCSTNIAGGTGGTGGGGSGAQYNGAGNYVSGGSSGTANTGGGGGGSVSQNVGGAGGSGIVIISYAGATQLMAGGTVTISGGNVIHTFTSTGYLAPIELVSNSLRFRSSATAYLNRTPPTAGNTKTFTYSAWVKRGSLSSLQNLISSVQSGNSDSLRFTAADQIEYIWSDTSSGQVTTTQLFRDPAAWYHIMYAMDTTQATAANRFKLYVNGVQVTAFATSSYPAQNTIVNNTGAVATKLGQYVNNSTQSFDGYMTEVNLIDGQALTPNSFGTINSYGVWQPITYGGSYGTNGFYLPFISNSSTYAGSFGGSSQFLVTSTNASLALGTNSFTIEYWLCITVSAGGATAVSMGNSTTTYDSLFGYQSGAGIILYLSSNGSAWDIASGINMGTTPVGTWNHVAVTRSGNTFYTFLNGVQQATFSSSSSIYQSANSVAIARAQNGSSVNGNISNVRVVVGTALYTSNFTIPTSNLTAVTNTKLLTLQDATIVDNSTNALTFTNTGSVVTGLTYPFSAAKVFNDQGPQGNNWTPSGISGSIGSTLDLMTDVPTLTSATAANYCTWNPLSANATVTDGNLQAVTQTGGSRSLVGTLGVRSGKYYAEMTIGSTTGTSMALGVVASAYDPLNVNLRPYTYGDGVIYNQDGTKSVNGTSTAYGASYATGNVIGIAIDFDTNQITFYKNNTSQGSIAKTFSGDYLLCLGSGTGTGSQTATLNCGQRPFTYTPPSGFVALNTFNL